MDKQTVAVTLKLTEETDQLFRKAGKALYGKDHPVPHSVVIRELAKLGAQKVLKKPKNKKKIKEAPST